MPRVRPIDVGVWGILAWVLCRREPPPSRLPPPPAAGRQVHGQQFGQRIDWTLRERCGTHCMSGMAAASLLLKTPTAYAASGSRRRHQDQQMLAATANSGGALAAAFPINSFTSRRRRRPKLSSHGVRVSGRAAQSPPTHCGAACAPPYMICGSPTKLLRAAMVAAAMAGSRLLLWALCRCRGRCTEPRTHLLPPRPPSPCACMPSSLQRVHLGE